MTSSAGKYVRQAAAAHPRLPVESLPALLADEDKQVVEEAAAARVLPVECMHRMMDEAQL
jgi:leucine rich repeat (LRR) protein